jgi:hypothetical protein
MFVMPKARRNTPLVSAVFCFKQRKPVPHRFVLDTIAPLLPYTRPMFGCLATYLKDKIVLILRDKSESAADNGVWLATTEEHHESLRREFPNMRSIQVLGKPVTGWQVLPADAPDFEKAALCACELILAGDPRIGKVPGSPPCQENAHGVEQGGADRRKAGHEFLTKSCAPRRDGFPRPILPNGVPSPRPALTTRVCGPICEKTLIPGHCSLSSFAQRQGPIKSQCSLQTSR